MESSRVFACGAGWSPPGSEVAQRRECAWERVGVPLERVDHRGSVDKFMGDCVMATFTGEGHRHLAALACLEIKEAVRSMQGTLQEKIGFSPDVSIGLNAGEVVYGPIGARRVNRFDFTVIGDVVNTASRLQALAGPGDIMITEEFAQFLVNEYVLLKQGPHQLKGKAEPMELYSILDLRD